ncbi:MAG TPA: PbpA [Desulfobacterales bacterium]|nr:PbpA [Desulfobacterales bacterium]
MRNRIKTRPIRQGWRQNRERLTACQLMLPEETTFLAKGGFGKRLFKRIFKCAILIPFLFVAYQISNESGGAVSFYEKTVPNFSSEDKLLPDSAQITELPKEYKPLISKNKVRNLLDSKIFVNLKEDSFDFVSDNDHHFYVETSIDTSLQNFILKKMDTSTSRYVGIVAMDPYTGRVLAMVGFDEDDASGNPCTDNRFPAASVFKIVTAAAAIEKCGFDSDSQLTYSGRKHTLYKSQLREKTKRRVRKITLRDSFAQSINSVFGKIGIHQLGKTTLQEYAEAFGFNRNIDFEIPLAPSVISISDEPYRWAEIASGFNRETTISPLHGALIASAVLNRGRLIEPVIIDKIKDEEGQVIYQSRLTPLNQAITPHASEVMNDLMKATIQSGTCRKMFRGYKKDPVLSRLSIGGKSGSISSKARDARFDWFVGFAEEKDGHEKIVISAVIAHGKYIGIRAAQYARILIKKYFSNYFSNKASESEKQNS